ncbi:hypothetical protein PSR1_00413 [Anaeromyxobacter sp. PSR-1]|nr:hypothetical protein PSR1_00413 [Anaeromyxobacter sp. PSR-1]
MVLIRRPTWRSRVLALLGAWAIGLVAALIYLFPDLPRTWRGWVAFAILAPPAVLLLERMGERLPELGKRISPARFSVLRIAIGVVALVLLFAPVVWWRLRVTGG